MFNPDANHPLTLRDDAPAAHRLAARFDVLNTWWRGGWWRSIPPAVPRVLVFGRDS